MLSKIPLRQFLFIAALTACARESDPSRTDTSEAGSAQAGACSDTRLRGEGIGALRIGAPLDSVKSDCRVLRDTTLTAAEGMPAQKLTVEIAGETVEAEVVEGKVWRISVRSPRFQTADSLGVGTPLSRLLKLSGARGMMGEGALYFTSSAHCGLSFRLSENRPLDPTGDWNAPALARLPASTNVTEVLVFGCGR